MAGGKPSRDSPGLSELVCGHFAPPSTPFRSPFTRDDDMDSETAHDTRASSPTTASDVRNISTPLSSPPATMETCDCAQSNETRPKKKKKLKKDSIPSVWQPTLTLENSGSVARDHLASERTFLAYVRTSLTIASTGVGTSMKLIAPHATFAHVSLCPSLV